MTTTLLKTQHSHYLEIAFNRPDRLNALTPEMLISLNEEILAANSDASICAVVITGNGRAFSAGVDLDILSDIKPQAGKIGEMFDQPAAQLAKTMRSSDKPIIAKVNGVCFTGALEIALHCDLIAAIDTAKFGDTHAKFGLRPTWGLSQTLPRAVGLRRAKDLSFSARVFSGRDAANWGLVSYLSSTLDELNECVSEICKSISLNSSDSIAAYKDLYRLAEMNGPIDEALRGEARKSYDNIKDTAERLKALR